MVTKSQIVSWMAENGGGVLFDPLNPDVISGYVTFTPERATSALENNTKNRKISKEKSLPVLKEAIRSGKWDDNVSKINFDVNGNLSDGQHRLTACVETGIPIRCIVSWGVKESAQRATDRGSTRSLSNDLYINGYADANNYSAIAKVVYLRENGGYDVKALLNGGAAAGRGASDATYYDYFEDHSNEIIEKSRLVCRTYASVRDLKINKSIMNVLVLEFDKINPVDAAGFWKRLSNGISTGENDPIVILRKRLSENAKSKTNAIPVLVMAALIIKAWNFYMRGETTKLLKYKSGGANPEPFPEIYNPYEE